MWLGLMDDCGLPLHPTVISRVREKDVIWKLKPYPAFNILSLENDNAVSFIAFNRCTPKYFSLFPEEYDSIPLICPQPLSLNSPYRCLGGDTILFRPGAIQFKHEIYTGMQNPKFAEIFPEFRKNIPFYPINPMDEK